MATQNTMSLYRQEVSEKKFGKCVICGDRVLNRHDFVTAEEGYCHRACL